MQGTLYGLDWYEMVVQSTDAYMTDEDGNYITDEDGNRITVEATE